MKKTILVLMLIFAMILSSCGSSKNDKTTNGGIDNSKIGGTLNLASYTPDTLNPMATQYSCIRDFLYLVYEGLFVVNEDLTSKGVLAKGYSVSNDNTVYTIKLKNGVKFHDGSNFDADDVIATLSYISNYSFEYASKIKDIKSYSKKDNYTVEIVLKSPKAKFENNLDFPILPSGLVFSDFKCPNGAFVPNGTGRYKYNQTIKYRYLELEKNDSWHGETAVYIPNVNVRFLDSNDAMLYAFNSGETDLISTERARWGEFPYKTSVISDEITTTKYMYLGINNKAGALGDVKVRRALLASLNTKQMADTAMFSHATVAQTPFSSKASFNTPDETVSKNLEKADLKSSNMSLYILYNEGSLPKQLIADYIKKALGEKGIKVKFTKVDYETYCNRVQNGEYELYIGEVNMSRDLSLEYMFDKAPQVTEHDENPPVDNDVEVVGESQNIDDDYSGSALSKYRDLELDNLIENLNTASGDENLVIAYGNFKKYFLENLPQIPLFHVKDALMMNRRIHGKINKNLTSFYADLGEIYIKNK